MTESEFVVAQIKRRAWKVDGVEFMEKQRSSKRPRRDASTVGIVFRKRTVLDAIPAGHAH
jgi:hypothetical protein